jgi:cholesterol transport system auxiliary component
MKRLIFLLPLFLVLVACSSKTIHMYTLGGSSSTELARSPYAGKDVRVEYPKGIDDTMSTRIYYTRSDLTRSYYLYNQWSLPLNRLIMGRIIETLQRAHAFRHVLDYASEAGSDYRLETTIYRFEHRITPEGSFADISIGLRLLRTSDGTLVKSRRFDYSIPCPRTDAEGFVKAADEAMRRFGSDMLRWLRSGGKL